MDWTLESWKSSLKAMGIDSDIVFFGDSIIRGGQWSEYFSEYNIVNLGISGDTVLKMDNRVDMIASLSPEKVFILGGINSLDGKNFVFVLEQYRKMIKDIKNIVPDARLYVQSVLPISEEKEKECVNNHVIVSFNNGLKELAEESNAVYINIHDLYTENGVMNSELTKDGIHLKPEAYSFWVEAIRGYVEQ